MGVILVFGGFVVVVLLCLLCGAVGWAWAKIGTLEHQVRTLQRDVDELRDRARGIPPPPPTVKPLGDDHFRAP